jgi:hypothetical protein
VKTPDWLTYNFTGALVGLSILTTDVGFLI